MVSLNSVNDNKNFYIQINGEKIIKMDKYGTKILLVETFPFKVNSKEMLKESIKYENGTLLLTRNAISSKNGNLDNKITKTNDSAVKEID